ncbi:sce7726 family protein [Mesorhizobium sp. A556]
MTSSMQIQPGHGGRVAPNASQLSAMTRLFSSGVFREMASKGRSALFTRLFSMTEIGQRQADATVGNAFDSAFDVLKIAGRRDEYVYRAALTKKVLLGKHSLNTACMLNEFRAGACKADLAILNGTATVYEIKSERDSLARLSNQLVNYQKVFASVNVIASESHVHGVLATVPDHVGVLSLTRRYTIEIIRDAVNAPQRTCSTTIFESVRTAEARAMLKLLGLNVPDLPNTRLHAAMRDLFAGLPSQEVHAAMVKTLKRTRDLAPLSDLVDRLPPSLHAAALSIQVRRDDHKRLVEAVSTPLDEAMAWV